MFKLQMVLSVCNFIKTKVKTCEDPLLIQFLYMKPWIFAVGHTGVYHIEVLHKD